MFMVADLFYQTKLQNLKKEYFLKQKEICYKNFSKYIWFTLPNCQWVNQGVKQWVQCILKSCPTPYHKDHVDG